MRFPFGGEFEAELGALSPDAALARLRAAVSGPGLALLEDSTGRLVVAGKPLGFPQEGSPPLATTTRCEIGAAGGRLVVRWSCAPFAAFTAGAIALSWGVAWLRAPENALRALPAAAAAAAAGLLLTWLVGLAGARGWVSAALRDSAAR